MVYISEDGYFATNIFDYEYSYFIGKEAAGQIISYIQKHSTETKSSTSLPTISGTVTEIGNGYIMVDDTILCRKSKAGKKYKVYTDDIKVRRWIESGEVKAGDLVAVEYEGEISNDYEVKGAYRNVIVWFRRKCIAHSDKMCGIQPTVRAHVVLRKRLLFQFLYS